MRRVLPLLMKIFVVCLLSGCTYNNVPNEYSTYNGFPNERWVWDDSQGEKCAVNVMNCFINKDVEGLKSMFCSNIAYGSDLEEKIPDAFEFIDGDIISYDDYISCGSGASYDNGELTDQHFEPFIDNIKTNTGKTYTMNVVLYTVYHRDEGYVGVTSIVICANNNETYTLGIGA